MSNHRYAISFIITSIISTILYLSFTIFAKEIEKPKKKLSKSTIKISIINPIIEKVIEKKSILIPSKAPVPIVIPIKAKKRVIKRKSIKKKIVKKRVVKRKSIKKKIVKKRVIKRKSIKKKIVEKRVIKRKSIKKKIVKQRVIREKVIKKKKTIVNVAEPIIEDAFIPVEQPRRVVASIVVKNPIEKKAPIVKAKIDKGVEKKRFLSQLRKKIITNKRYPKMALRRHIEGSVKVKFNITISGDVSNIRFLNGKRVLQKGARKAIEKSFPISIPNYLRSELPIKDIYVTIHFNIY